MPRRKCVLLALAACFCASALFAQRRSIDSIAVTNERAVLAPNGQPINKYVNGGISDEHQSIFPPGSLGGNSDYLFFVATRTTINTDTGVLVLRGGSGPDANGQWAFDVSSAYGASQVFLSPVGRGCPTVADANPAHQDQTFDLNYAAAGSVLPDPTAPAGNLLMIYEGTITCFGTTGGPRSTNFYSTTGIATSRDYGKTWPAYRGSANFSFAPMPQQNTTQGPQSPFGAHGSGVCEGTNCAVTLPSSYGRYAVLTPSVSVATAMATGQPLPGSMGDAEVSAFLDDVAPGTPNVYLVYNYGSGNGALSDPAEPNGDLMIARAPLNGGTAPLTFSKWDNNAYASHGLGGYDTPIFPSGAFQSCEAAAQLRTGASVSYVDDAQQYLLLFVCNSPGDPAAGNPSGSGRGGAWFYATTPTLSDNRQWTTPREIAGSWNAFDTSGGCGNFHGWYPTAMSPGKKSGHLGTAGYVFYLSGCQTGDTPPPGRQYTTRQFTMTLGPVQTKHRAARH